MKIVYDKRHLFDALDTGAIVLTPTNRLSHHLWREYFKTQKKEALIKPPIFAYKNFLSHLQHSLLKPSKCSKTPALLTELLERTLWKEVFAEEKVPAHPVTLNLISDAYEKAVSYHLNPQDLAFEDTPQTRFFKSMWVQFNAKKQCLKAISSCELELSLCDALHSLKASAIYWACFDEFTPHMRSLQDLLENLGIPQYRYEIQIDNPRPLKYALSSIDEEHEAICTWVRAKRQEGCQNIGIVVPDLEGRALNLERTLNQLIKKEEYTLSLGTSLAKEPIVSHALLLLSESFDILSPKTLEILFSSPFIKGSVQEFYARQHFLLNLSEQTKALNISTWLNQQAASLNVLTKCLSEVSPYPEEATPEDWVKYFKQRLIEFGFPGEQSLSSQVYQAYQRLINLLDDWQQVGVIHSSMKRTNAIASLSDYIHQTIFKIKEHHKPIRIMGLLEAQGLNFEALWICGLTHDVLPQKTNLHPFLPHSLQKTHEMPKASQAKELKLAKSMLQRLLHASETVIVSYPCLEGDTHLLPSPLIESIPLGPPIQSTPSFTSSLLKAVPVLTQIPVKINESLKGGSALLAYQAQCPFKAFAAYRLKAKGGELSFDGYSPSERGQILHKSCELLWNRLKTQKELLEISEAEEATLIEAIVNEAFTHFQATSLALLEDVEKERIQNLLNAFVQFEKQRPSFSIVELEKAHTLEIKNLTLHLRIDRIDRTSDEKKWVIDYKSRFPSAKPWDEERPSEPQLLLYALVDDKINTLAYFELQKGKIQCLGISEEKNDIQGLQTIHEDLSFEELKATWQSRIEVLAQEILEGYCSASPQKMTVCEFCDFPSLCRI